MTALSSQKITRHTSVPTMNDDITLGYEVCHLWSNAVEGGKVYVCQRSDAGNALWFPVAATNSVVQGSKGYINRCQLTYVDAKSITVGETARTSTAVDDTDDFVIQFFGLLTADITVSGAGGLDTGSETVSTWYSAWVMADTTLANTPKAILSLSSTAPTLPTGYDVYRRVGWVRNNASGDFIKFVQFGLGSDREYLYDIERIGALVLSGGNATTFTAVDLSSRMPPTSRATQIWFEFVPKTATNKAQFRLSGSSVVDPITIIQGQVANKEFATGGIFFVSAAQQIDYQVSDAADVLDMYVNRFGDTI